LPHPLSKGQWDGVAIEVQRGHNLPANYPVVDIKPDFQGVVTSIKSRDLDLPSYQNPSKLLSVIKRDIDKLSTFEGKKWADINIESHQINSRVLDLVTPHPGTPQQQQAIQQAIEYGLSKPNPVIVKPVVH
jgi:hypothetical protein